jgi:hypothetical protein
MLHTKMPDFSHDNMRLHCQVLGAPGVYAMGDCATIAVNSLVKDMEKLYKEAQQLDPQASEKRGLTPQAFIKFIEVSLCALVFCARRFL